MRSPNFPCTVFVLLLFALRPAAAGAGTDCGTHFYDDGVPEDALFFSGGGHAGEPDHLFAVKYELADFAIAPGQMIITGFCAGNFLDFSAFGGPWPNEVFVYPDLDGLPDLDRPLVHTTMLTGDGQGWFTADFPEPLVIDGDFWLMNHGYPPHAGEDFNMETDQSSKPAGRSYITDRGLPFIFVSEQNFLLRAILAANPAPLLPAPRAVPVLSSRPALWGLIAILVAAAGYMRRKGAR